MNFSLKRSLVLAGGVLVMGYGVALAQRASDAPVPVPVPAPIVQTPLNDYKAPAASRSRLGKINQLLAYGVPVKRDFKGLAQMLRLPDGTLFIDADLDTDADGSPRSLEIDPQCGQLETSFNFEGEDGQRQYVDAERVPYIVLPLEFYKDMGVGLGDVAAVVWKNRVVYALFADTGPKELIGEGSVALSEALGFDPWERSEARLQIVNGIEDHVLMLVFPQSAVPDLTPENINQKTIDRAKPLFQALGGNADYMER